MSGFTSEGTEFEGGACRACGARSYGLLSDGPRCHGCKRFVLKDTEAGRSEMPQKERRQQADAALDAEFPIWAECAPDEAIDVYAMTEESYRPSALPSDWRPFPPTESRRARRRRAKREKMGALTADAALAEAEAILHGWPHDDDMRPTA